MTSAQPTRAVSLAVTFRDHGKMTLSDLGRRTYDLQLLLTVLSAAAYEREAPSPDMSEAMELLGMAIRDHPVRYVSYASPLEMILSDPRSYAAAIGAAMLALPTLLSRFSHLRVDFERDRLTRDQLKIERKRLLDEYMPSADAPLPWPREAEEVTEEVSYALSDLDHAEATVDGETVADSRQES